VHGLRDDAPDLPRPDHVIRVIERDRGGSDSVIPQAFRPHRLALSSGHAELCDLQRRAPAPLQRRVRRTLRPLAVKFAAVRELRLS